ncbi:MexH family multidrug efflux RND transporter periplasmic adaptor subunit [Sphingomonas paucimobilis]|uniref:DNA, contig: SP612 n=1 Tax=Sphingomonas paucimobilis NBRC 13935 TaxID=1219050 RepID=A0A0C9NCY6_SPHPI|nr:MULTISPECIES: efflux RND transporter periplasmic adaptor subunit [Sphingomonas]MCM3679519.1 efflux RND transporter periplasmic adaptor subunit [Sphingomonas paucimobilis]MDG5972235.1 efflux RND transporter periplasmic adaptor subunit [Sphingomonas paucimobilis]SUJ20010.1 Multidrug resistance protein mexA precursor [Sphingomonas paucimobilis]BCI70129.1 MexH family multidrug efflux RND transporter periplasmic adaptor subunit [Sphingomonas paucimobilis]GAN12613.1 putative efflux system protein
MNDATERTGDSQVLSWRQALIALAIVGLTFGLFFGWRWLRVGIPPQAAPPAVAVVATAVTPREVPSALEAVGSLRAVQEVTLAPEVAGRVTAIALQPGVRVSRGAALVQLYDAPEQADRVAALARMKLAAAQLARTRSLVPGGAESQELLQQRQAEYDQAAAAVRQLDARIAQKRIRAPFSGQIGIRRINLGQYLNPGDAVATLTAIDRLYADFTVPQQDLGKLRLGATVRLTTDAWPSRTFRGRVTTIEPRIGEDSRNVMVQALVINSDSALRPGMYVTAALELPPRSNALVVPATAIQTSASGDSVTVIRGHVPSRAGKAEIVPVVIGRRIGNSVIVTSGIRPGDVVVAEGQLRVQPGAQVRVVRLVSATIQASGV